MRGVKKKKSKWEIRGQVKTARRHEGRGEPTPTRMMDEGGGGRRERWGRMERGRLMTEGREGLLGEWVIGRG